MRSWQRICALNISALMLVSWAAAAPASVPVSEGGDINSVYLGAADGKQYFATNTPMIWNDANKHCLDSNMKLASVTTMGQLKLFEEAYKQVTHHGDYWTAARDARDLSQFVWDTDGSSINSTIVTIPDTVPPLRNCLAYVLRQQDPHFHVTPCTYERHVICEI